MPIAGSLLEYCGESDGDHCGYCKNTRCMKKGASKMEQPSDDEEGKGESLSLGLWAHALSNGDYLSLMDRGWRRSGKFLYKPTNDRTCCPQYTIRLDVTKFFLSRSQKRTLRQMNEFLETGKKPRCAVKDEHPIENAISTESSDAKNTSSTSTEDAVKPKKSKNSEDRPVMKKKEMRLKRFEENCRKKNIDIEDLKKKRKEKEDARRRTIESFILERKEDWKHDLKVQLVPVDGEEFDARDNESFELYKKYQETIHKDTGCRLAGYRRFLCVSPLKPEKEPNGKFEYGSYHLRFILDDKLIAVSVLDILPRCLSAKYMFYDPDFSFLSLGTYTALREIEQTKKFYEMNADLKYYYMGYYIDSCPKMRYKAKFRPSDLLCDRSFQWLEYDKCVKLFKRNENGNGYTVFFENAARPPALPVADLLVHTDRTCVKYSTYLNSHPEIAQNETFQRKIEQLAQMVGPHLSRTIFYFDELN